LLESKSEHPLAKAVVEAGKEWHFDTEAAAEEISDFTALPGNGLSGTLSGVRLLGGNLQLMRENTTYPIPDSVLASAEELSGQGKTPLFFAADGDLLGIIAVADVIKEDSYEGIRQLKNMGIHVVMLTGDNELTAAAIAEKAGVEEVIAGVLPEGKAEVIKTLQKKYGKVAMVGDGINDAPALTVADIGIAIGAGTDVAIDAADVVLMHSKLTDVSAAVRLSRQTLRNIKENLFWAFFYNVICIPLAAGCFHGLGVDLNPMIGAAAMSLSSFCVVMNALRLNLFRIRNTKRDKPLHRRKDEGNMNEGKREERVIKVDGMMCEHCEASVKKALEAVKNVESATADHKAGTVTLSLTGTVKDAKLKKAVEEAGYRFLG
ncbi:MAG TPA: HAD-IC family P-type ATPase, partial [Clostridiales bacterium]|nr:HAD-IC family P-type ATPase [Clostridiales bacterium]